MHVLSETCIRGGFAIHVALCFGVPQGSILGPNLFTLHTRQLGEAIHKHGALYHLLWMIVNSISPFDRLTLRASLRHSLF